MDGFGRVDHSVGHMLTHVDAFCIGWDCGSRRLFGGCSGLTVLQKRPSWLFYFVEEYSVNDGVMDAIVRWVQVQGQKQRTDLTSQEFFAWINRGSGKSERSVRRVIKSLGLCKNERGYYSQAHVVVLFAWINRRERFYSGEDFMDRVGRQLYMDAQKIDFTLFEKFGEIDNAR